MTTLEVESADGGRECVRANEVLASIRAVRGEHYSAAAEVWFSLLLQFGEVLAAIQSGCQGCSAETAEHLGQMLYRAAQDHSGIDLKDMHALLSAMQSDVQEAGANDGRPDL